MSKYRFIGKDGSMGYRHGKVYRGRLHHVSVWTVYFEPSIFNPLSLPKVIIPYEGSEKFFENWEVV